MTTDLLHQVTFVRNKNLIKPTGWSARFWCGCYCPSVKKTYPNTSIWPDGDDFTLVQHYLVNGTLVTRLACSSTQLDFDVATFPKQHVAPFWPWEHLAGVRKGKNVHEDRQTCINASKSWWDLFLKIFLGYESKNCFNF